MNAITRRLQMADGVRRSPATAGGVDGHKEWMHFCAFHPAADVLVNFSLMDGVQTLARRGVEVARVALLARMHSTWAGSVDRIDRNVDVRAGRIDIAFGDNAVRYVDGEFEVRAASNDGRISVDMKFRPAVTPIITPSAPMQRGFVRWLIVPAMTANGRLSVDGRSHVFERASAYHDHNWGSFHWGHDFSWQWGVLLDAAPDSCRSVVISRVLDRDGHVVHSDSLLAGDDAGFRDFRGPEVDCRRIGLVRERPRCRVPPVIDLVLDDYAVDLPAEIEIVAETSRDRIEAALHVIDYAQIGIPNDGGDLGVSVLTEARARGVVHGRFRGQPWAFEGPALWEETGGA